MAELAKQRVSLREDMSTLIKSSIQLIQSSVDSLREQKHDFQSCLDHTKTVVGGNFEKLTAVEATIKSLQAQNSSLLDSLDDLVNRSRKANLQIVNIPEGNESGRDPVEFISKLLKDSMGAEIFQKPPRLERAHRTPGYRHGGLARPWAFVVCFHYFQEKERALH